MGLELQAARPSDVAAIRALVNAAYAKWIPVIGRKPMPMRADYDRAIRDHIFDLHFRDGALAGLIEMNLHPNHLYIVNIAVAERLQGYGIGRALLAHAEAVAHWHELVELRLLTNERMQSNRALYARCGYEELHIEQHPTGSGVVHMRKRLAGSDPASN